MQLPVYPSQPHQTALQESLLALNALTRLQSSDLDTAEVGIIRGGLRRLLERHGQTTKQAPDGTVAVDKPCTNYTVATPRERLAVRLGTLTDLTGHACECARPAYQRELPTPASDHDPVCIGCRNRAVLLNPRSTEKELEGAAFALLERQLDYVDSARFRQRVRLFSTRYDTKIRAYQIGDRGIITLWLRDTCVTDQGANHLTSDSFSALQQGLSNVVCSQDYTY